MLKQSLFLSCMLLALSCGKNETGPGPAGLNAPNTMPALSGVAALVDQSLDGSVKLSRIELTPQEIAQERARYIESDLRQIPADASYNAMLFKIDNVDSYKNTVFIAPKIYVYGGQDKARLTPKHLADGRVSLDFPVVLTTATSREIVAPDGNTTIQLPETMLVKNQEKLVTELHHRFGTPQILAPLPGCPKHVYLKVGDQEYRVTPAEFSRGDYCQLNTPMTISITLEQQDARHLLESAIYNSAASISVIYETRARIAVARMEIGFDKSKVFTELEAMLKVNAFWADVEIKSKVTEVMQKQIMRMSFVGEITPQMHVIVSEATRLFFEQMRPDPNGASSGCSGKPVCFRLNYNSLNDQQEFKVVWQQSKNELMGQNYVTWAPLHPLDDSIQIGGQSRRELTRSASIETGLTVREDDLIEITPDYLKIERRSATTLHTSRQDHPTCLETKRVCVYRECRGGPRGDRWAPMEKSLEGLIEPASQQPHLCTCEEWKEECVRSENRWVQTTQYGLNTPVIDQLNNPVAQLEEIYEGLAFKLTWSDAAGKSHESICPLNLFEREGDGKSLLIRLQNRPSCRIFETGSNAPMLHLVNQISFPINYRDGALVQNWLGQILQSPTERVFTPDVSFAGKVLIRGYKLGTSNAFSSKR